MCVLLLQRELVWIMKINAFCMSCLVQSQARRIEKFEDEEKKSLLYAGGSSSHSRR